MKSKEKKRLVSKELLNKIKRGIDNDFFVKIGLCLILDEINIEELENDYDSFFLVPNETNEKQLKKYILKEEINLNENNTA